jgi:hypothetical protein
MSIRRFNVYIDESGDEGFRWHADGTGATRWFIISAIVVEASDDLQVSRCLDRIKDRLSMTPRTPLHWIDCRRHEQRKVIVQEMAQEPLRGIVVAMDKKAIQHGFLKKSPALYFYTTRLVLERVAWMVDDAGGRADCILENRAHLSYKQLQTYLRRLSETSQLRPVIDDVVPKPKEQAKLLQVADAFAGATYAAPNPDRYGNVETTYLDTLSPLLYRHQGKVLGYGFKMFPEWDGQTGKQWGTL